jgi:phosphatidylserine/phosphatidylglycerophosphate/cardiolipin synthase-like enzyme
MAAAATTAKGKPVPVGYSDYKDVPCNRITWGDLLKEEVLSGLNLNVDYLHTKYMLIDPLTDNPTVITGSANFSDNSTTMNDENMLVISGDKRVAEIYLTEFMRLFKHFQHRNKVNAMPANDAGSARFLAGDDSWTKPYFQPGTAESAERLLFR